MQTKIIYASSVAKLDSNVHTGGGTDNTAAIQAVLDMAKDGDGVHLIMDGAALISKIKLYSNTTIECLNKDCGFFQIPHTDDCMVTNAIWDDREIKTWNISLLGGTYNQNCRYQAHDNPHQGYENWVAPIATHLLKSLLPCVWHFMASEICWYAM